MLVKRKAMAAESEQTTNGISVQGIQSVAQHTGATQPCSTAASCDPHNLYYYATCQQHKRKHTLCSM